MSSFKKVHVQGMTCVSCEVIITDELTQVEGVNKVSVCHKKQIAKVHYHHDNVDPQALLTIIENLGYQASFEPITKKKEKASLSQWLYALLIVLGFYIVYRYLRWIGVFDWINIDPTNVTYGASFLIGLVASLSSCLAVVGAVVISFGAKYKSKGGYFESNVKPHLLFHVGRLATFFVLGGILGLIGSWFSINTTFMGWFTLVIALVLVWLGLNILGFVPSLSSVGVRMPRKATAVWNRLKNSEHHMAPVLLGAFTFFLPCGFTQSMQLFAISSGNFWIGAMTMLFFGLGTAPVLLGVGVASSGFKNAKAIAFKKAMGFVVIVFALYTASAGFAMAGIDVSFFDKTIEEQTVVQGGVQTVVMNVDRYGYNPNTIRVKSGIPVRWVINAQELNGCSGEIIMPAINLRKQLVQGENIVEFTPTGQGTIPFSCWMGMIRGKFIVE